MPNEPGFEEAAPSPRRKLVDEAREAWIRRLVDTSRRNNLLYFRDLKAGTLDLTRAEPQALQDLLNGEKVPINRLIPTIVDPNAGSKLREIVRKARTNLEEKGLETLYFAFGMATWEETDGGRPPEAAVLLMPIVIDEKIRDDGKLTVRREGAAQFNLALAHILSEHGVTVEEEDFSLEEDEETGLVDPLGVLAKLSAVGHGISGFTVTSRAVIGNFSFQKLAMVRDLTDLGDEIEEHDVIAALAGDSAARERVSKRRVDFDPAALDTVPPTEEFMVLDADSSQQCVIHAVALGSDGVIQGPPGCGKSQTIANIISTLVADGKKVLFVAEKRAALEAVFKRLDSNGLRHIALDLHGASISQKVVIRRVDEALREIKRALDPPDDEIHEQFSEIRDRLVEHQASLHTPVPPFGLTPFQLQAELMGIPSEAASKTRFRSSDLAGLDRTTCRRVEGLLEEAAGHANLFCQSDASPWTRANLDDATAAQDAIDAARMLAEVDLPELSASLEVLASECGIPLPTTLDTVAQMLEAIGATREFLEEYLYELFVEAPALVFGLTPAEKGGLASFLASLTNAPFRKARRRMNSLSRAGKVSAAVALRDARRAVEIDRQWRQLGAEGVPSTATPDISLSRSLEAVRKNLSRLCLAVPTAKTLSIEELRATSKALVSDLGTAYAIPRLREIDREIAAAGAGAIVAEIRKEGVPASEWILRFRHAVFASSYDAARIVNRSLSSFSGQTHSGFAQKFKQLDRKRVEIAAARVKRAHAQRAIEAMNEFADQATVVRGETAKQSRHLPLRRLLQKAPEVLTAICPCWMSSPLNVSQLLPGDAALFDVVIFDEASQVLPEDAISAILRGKRIVVAGDRNQLPPTTFFADGGAEEDAESEVAGYQSLLDQLTKYVEPWPLEWHYRSRDERLIAFSNRHIYGNSLVTFPGIGGDLCVSHVLVDGAVRDGEEESSSAEVRQVVALILEHAQRQVEMEESRWQSLGVITMGIKHALRIQAELDRNLIARPDLESFFDPTREERFFIKNLEQVQGDERDAILISIGYGKDRNGRLPYRFGPLLQEGGERRLNVAVSRARRKMTVVSSFSHQDMDPSRSSRRGVELLRLFLQFAASEGVNLGDSGMGAEEMNAFERDVYDSLSSRGVPLLPQYGVSGYRLDFAAQHPEKLGQFVLAIECDGASYHSAPTARDRDRLRQQQLESIGWTFHRIWSTEWFLRREAQIEAAVGAWEAAVREADAREEAKRAVTAPVTGGRFEEPAEPVPPTVLAPTETRRTDRPAIPIRDGIDLYSLDELVSLVRWVQSDGLLLTDDEIISELVRELGFARKGPRIVAALRQAIGITKE